MRLGPALPLAVVLALAACETPQQPPAESPASVPPSPAGPHAAPPPSVADAPPAAPPSGAAETVEMPPAAEAKRLATSSNALAFDLWGRLRAAKGNLAMSPASISMALAMTYGGANGETAAEMRKVLHSDEEPDALMSSWGKLSRALSDPSRPMTLRIANRLFGESSYTFEKPYLDRTRAAFGAPLEPVDFKSSPDPSRVRINAWVEEQTEKRIKDLLPGGAIKPSTRLVLVNAIYFLGTWDSPFDPARTADEPFKTTAKATKKVPTMHQVTHARLARAGGVKVLELPYKGRAASLLVALPDKVDGLAALESSLSNATLEGWTRALANEHVDVAMPRFELTGASISLAKELQALGMAAAFDRKKADFTRMANPKDPGDRLGIDDVFHKAFVKLDEKGTEAAAATGVVMATRAAAPAPKLVDFKVDHPFLFFVVDQASGLVLFMGRVTDP